MKSRVCLALINYVEHDSYTEVWLVYPVILCWRLLICHFPTGIITKKKILCYDWAFVFLATCPCSNFVFWELVQPLCMLSQSLEFYMWINSVVLERNCFLGITYHLWLLIFLNLIFCINPQSTRQRFEMVSNLGLKCWILQSLSLSVHLKLYL